MTNQQGAPEALRPIARYSIGYATDDWGMRSSSPSGIPDPAGAWVRYEDHIAALVDAQQPAPSAAAVVNPDPHAELRKTWQPGQRWQARSFRNGQWGPWTDAVASEPFWFPHQDYRRHPDDLAPQPAPTPQADSQPAQFVDRKSENLSDKAACASLVIDKPAPEYVGNGMFKGETIQKAAEHWANWCDRRCMTGLSEFLRVVAARAPADSVMLDDGKTIQMTNLTKSLQDGNWNVEYWRGYGFTANNRTTTNGSLSFLLRCVNTPENQAAVMQFAREVAKIDQDAARQVARIDAANAARKQGANHD